MFSKILVASSLAAASATLYTEDHTQLKTLWENFKVTHSKKYDTMEDESRRFYLFVENLKSADLRNIKEKKVGGTAVHGITRFSDLSQTEFEAQYLTADVSQKVTANKVDITTPVDTTAGLVDWSGKYTTDVKDQGYCGSCWAFSATEQIESDTMRTLGQTIVLSPEQITQCASAAYGCGGGWTEVAYAYVKTAGGLETEADYPYTSSMGVTGTCHETSSKFKVTVDSFTTLNGESAMASYMQSTGPLSVCLDANNWNSYTGGIMSSCGKQVDHCVQAVGVDASAVGGYWKVRNSWGTGWGEAGYIRLAYGQNTCDITNDPTYVAVSTV